MSKRLTREVADIHNVTVQYVNMVIRGQRNNPAIKATYEMLAYGRTKLVEAVEKTMKIKKC